MKTSNNYDTNSIDRSVILFFLFAMLITVSVFAFRYVNHTPCEVISFDAEAKNFRAGEIIRFIDFTDGTVKREWDFGDSTDIRHGINPFHTYEKPGEYTVTLQVNGQCKVSKVLTIEEKAFVLDSSKLANFEIPASIRVGEVLRVKDNTKDAYKWEWRFGETAEVNSKKKNAKYIYESHGLKTVTLIVNGDSRYGTKKRIDVLPLEKKKRKLKKRLRKPKEATSLIKYAPTEVTVNDKPKEAFRAPSIREEEFKNKLVLVSKKKASAKDFSDYLCGNLQISMTTKGKRTTFVEFCEKIKGRNIKIKEIEIFRNKKNNCIEYLSVQYVKLGLFN